MKHTINDFETNYSIQSEDELVSESWNLLKFVEDETKYNISIEYITNDRTIYTMDEEINSALSKIGTDHICIKYVVDFYINKSDLKSAGVEIDSLQNNSKFEDCHIIKYNSDSISIDIDSLPNNRRFEDYHITKYNLEYLVIIDKNNTVIKVPVNIKSKVNKIFNNESAILSFLIFIFYLTKH